MPREVASAQRIPFFPRHGTPNRRFLVCSFFQAGRPCIREAVAVEAARSEEVRKEDAEFNDLEYDNGTVYIVYIEY